MGRMKVQNSPSIRRMPSYLHKLLSMRMEGRTHVSTTELAEYMNIELIVVRKDIALTGIAGLRRVGYDINALIDYIKDYLGWQQPVTATLIGAGALGSAILGYDDFQHYGLRIESVFDSDPRKVGQSVHGHEIFDFEDITVRLAAARPDMAIICVPGAVAQNVADVLVEMDIRYLWNFANVCLKVPKEVIVQREVIAGGFAMLTAKMKNARSRTPVEFDD